MTGVTDGDRFHVEQPTEAFPRDFEIVLLGALTARLRAGGHEWVVSLSELRTAIADRVLVKVAA